MITKLSEYDEINIAAIITQYTLLYKTGNEKELYPSSNPTMKYRLLNPIAETSEALLVTEIKKIIIDLGVLDRKISVTAEKDEGAITIINISIAQE